MHPAPSVIVFTVLSGLGFGFLALLGVGLLPATGWVAFGLWALGYGLAVAGLLASTFHLGHPERAWRAFSQWRTSWLSREGIAAVATLVLLAPVALSDWLGLGWPCLPGIIGAAMALATIGTTSMIYAQLKTVPRWNHWTTPAQFMAFALAGGALLAGNPARFVPGTELTLTTVSARSADRWTFTVEGPETLELPMGPTPTIKLQRLPRKDYDQKAELWVAPTLGYLPVRIQLTQANGDFADLQLRSSSAP